MNSSETRMLQVLAFVSLFALAMVTFLGKPADTSLQALDSATHAVLAERVGGHGVFPVLPIPNFTTNKITNPIFNDHPFTLFYLNGQVMKALGPSAFSVRLLPALFSAGCVLLTAWLGMLLYSAPAGLLAGVILLVSRDFVMIGSRFHLDTPMVFFILLSFVLWQKKFPLWAGVAAGLGVWMKSPVSLLLYPSVFFALVLTGGMNWRTFRTGLASAGVALLVGSGVWILTGIFGGWEWVFDYWTRQVWGTAVKARGNSGSSDFGYGIHLLFRTYLPWIWVAIGSSLWMLFRKQLKRFEFLLPLFAALVIELVIGAIRFKHYWYFIPVFPFLALVCVAPIGEWCRKRSRTIEGAIIGLGLFVPAFLVATPVSLGPENFPAIRKFNALIQGYGTCHDRVLFVNGGQPFGSDLDSVYELGFYSGRAVLHSECGETNALIEKESPEWIIVTGENRTRCIRPDFLSKYPVHYRYGSQVLFSRIIPAGAVNDLTPLHCELRPLNGCEVPALPTDSYFPK